MDWSVKLQASLLDISSSSQLGTLLYAVQLNSLGVERRPISLCETVGLSERWSLHIFVYSSHDARPSGPIDGTLWLVTPVWARAPLYSGFFLRNDMGM